MIHAAHILLGVYLFILCVNFGFYFLGNSFGMTSITQRSLDFQSLNSTFRSDGEEIQSNPFDPTFIFGDFGRQAALGWNMFTGGYFLTTLGNVGLSDYFIFPMEVIVLGFLLFAALLYWIGGRQ